MRKLLLQFIAIVFCSPMLFAKVNGGKKILIVATSSDKDLKYGMNGWGCYMPEVTDFYSTVYQFGYRMEDIDIVSPKGGKVPVIADMQADWELQMPAGEEAKLRAKLNSSLKPSEIDPSKYNIMYYAGGVSCIVDFPNDTKIADIAAKIYESGGAIGLVCDGITGLMPIKLSNGKYLVDGKKITTNIYNPSTWNLDIDGMLTTNGALLQKGTSLVVDSRIVTGMGVQPIQVARELMALIGKGRFPASVNDVASAGTLLCYPNPAKGAIALNLPAALQNADATYHVYNMTGAEVLKGKLIPGEAISLSGIATGGYIIKATTANTELHTMITVQ